MRLYDKFYHYIYEQHWALGFIEQPVVDIIENKPFIIHYVKGLPSDRWFADPFILDHDCNTIRLLVEEYCYRIGRGRIAKLIINRSDYQLLEYRIILDLPTHLSFPYIIRRGNHVFIAPENSSSGGWHLYAYNLVDDTLERIKSLSKKPLTDAVLTDFFEDNLIFSTQIPFQNGNSLSIYTTEDVLLQNCLFPSDVARNAGDWFQINQRVFRPAQDCSNCYGGSVIIQEVIRKDDGSFVFKNIRRIVSTHPAYTTGCHTFNLFNGLIVVDVHGYRRPRCVRVINTIKKYLKNTSA